MIELVKQKEENNMQVHEYALGYNRQLMQVYSDRRANHHAKFLLPHLKSGMDVLDIGCGPGAITTDIAKLVYPGTVLGIDMNDEQLLTARDYAQYQGVNNVAFKLEDACQLHLIAFICMVCCVLYPTPWLFCAKLSAFVKNKGSSL